MVDRFRSEHEQTEEEFIRIGEGSKLTAIPIGTLRQLCSRKLVPHYKRGRSVFFLKSELLAFLRAGKVA